MRIYIFLVLIFATIQLTAQANWTFESDIQFDQYTIYEGDIDGKYPIVMYLEESYESCSDEYIRWAPRKVYGWYKYKKVGKKIPLVGQICYADLCETYLKLFVPEDPINYIFDSGCNILKAREIFVKERGKDFFEWQMDDKQKLPVSLETTHQFSWRTKAEIALIINGVEIETFNLSELTENEYIESIHKEGEKYFGGKYYLILKYNHQTNPGSYGHGMCGAGIEEYIVHLVINKNFEVESFKQIQTESCLKNIAEKPVSYDPEKPELGITKL